MKRKGEVYKIKRGLLVVHQDGQDSDVDYWRVIIPDDVSTRNFVVAELHNIPYSLHPGVQRTLYKVRKHFFWKGMTGHIREFVESCPVCQVAKSDHTLNRGKLQSTNIPEKKWTEVSLDFITDLPVTKGMKDSILTVIDKATRMVHLIPCKKSVTAAETAKLYWDQVVKLHGVPKILYSDRGTQFTSQFWKVLWGLTGTQLRFSTAYHPQTQGVVERMNAVVGQMLRCTIGDEKGKNWDSLLPSIELTINSLPNSSTGYSPFYLNYGYHPTVPIELLKGDEEVKNEAIDNFVVRVQKTWESAKKNLLQSVQRQAKYYDMKHRELEYDVGELVLLSSRNLSFKGVPVKLQKKFVGPFEIVEKIGAQAYRLKLPDSWKIHDVFHISLLKRWRTAVYRQEEYHTQVELEESDEPRYEVEKILRWRKAKGTGRREYLTLWTGYPLEEATWEPEESFDDKEALLQSLQEDKPEEAKD